MKISINQGIRLYQIKVSSKSNNQLCIVNQKYSTAGPSLTPINNDDYSDTEEGIQTSLGERIQSMKVPMTRKEKRIINYIVAK